MSEVKANRAFWYISIFRVYRGLSGSHKKFGFYSLCLQNHESGDVIKYNKLGTCIHPKLYAKARLERFGEQMPSTKTKTGRQINRAKHWFQCQPGRWKTQIQSDGKQKLELGVGFCFPVHFSCMCVCTFMWLFCRETIRSIIEVNRVADNY